MPYVISTTDRASSASRQHWIDTGEYLPSRRAVATLDEARGAAKRVVEDADYAGPEAQQAMSDDAAWCEGMSGPSAEITLPDGTVIEVERVEWGDLTEYAVTRAPDALAATLIAAYNQKENS